MTFIAEPESSSSPGTMEKEIEAFVVRESRLLDERDYVAWFDLWTPDGIYWIPSNADDIDPMRHVSIVYEDRMRLYDRVNRLVSGLAHAQDPPSRMCRVVSSFEIAATTPAEWVVRHNFILVELRQGKQDTFAGNVIHHLRNTDDGLRIAFKKVLLVNNDDYIDNLQFIV